MNLVVSYCFHVGGAKFCETITDHSGVCTIQLAQCGTEGLLALWLRHCEVSHPKLAEIHPKTGYTDECHVKRLGVRWQNWKQESNFLDFRGICENRKTWSCKTNNGSDPHDSYAWSVCSLHQPAVPAARWDKTKNFVWKFPGESSWENCEVFILGLDNPNDKRTDDSRG